MFALLEAGDIKNIENILKTLSKEFLLYKVYSLTEKVNLSPHLSVILSELVCQIFLYISLRPCT